MTMLIIFKAGWTHLLEGRKKEPGVSCSSSSMWTWPRRVSVCTTSDCTHCSSFTIGWRALHVNVPCCGQICVYVRKWNVNIVHRGLLCVLAVHVEDIIFHMFQYIQKLRTEGPQEWVFEECKVIIVLCSARGAEQMWPTYLCLVETEQTFTAERYSLS